MGISIAGNKGGETTGIVAYHVARFRRGTSVNEDDWLAAAVLQLIACSTTAKLTDGQVFSGSCGCACSEKTGEEGGEMHLVQVL